MVFLCLGACTPKASSPKKTDGPERNGNAALSLERTDQPEADPPVIGGEAEKTPGKEWDEFTGPLELQKQSPRSHILPESFLIGPLSDSLSSRPVERAIVYAGNEFWKKYRSGSNLSSFLATYPHPLFLEELDEYAPMGEAIEAVETGRPQIEGSTARIPCLVFSDWGWLEGTLYLVREEGNWFIEDWEIPFRDWPGEEIGREEDVIAPPVNW
jgi:hypothetical protein